MRSVSALKYIQISQSLIDRRFRSERLARARDERDEFKRIGDSVQQREIGTVN